MRRVICQSFREKVRVKASRKYHSTEEYIQRSIVPTDHFQKSLPRLPIPKLEDSCRRYLEALKPVVSERQFERSRGIVENFSRNEGPALHKELLVKDKGEKHTSYISATWFEKYLSDRLPIVLNYNPFIVFKDDPRKAYMNQTLRATNFIVSSMRFRRSLRENVLEPDVYHLNPEVSDTAKFRKFVRKLPKSLSWYGAYWYKAFPLDMSQYGNLFNSTRIPKEGMDQLYKDDTGKHVLVIHRGRYFYFDVLDGNGNLIKAEEILANLRYICDRQSTVPPCLHPVGILTSENRDTWTKARQKLLGLGNAKQFGIVDSALFVVVLDEDEFSDVGDLGKSFLFGNAANRWFDKSFSLVINKSGISAINFEHSWGDGVAILRFMNDVFQDATNHPRLHPDSHPASSLDAGKMVKEIEWNTDEEVQATIREAAKNYAAATSKLDMAALMYSDMNKDPLKDKSISPDSFMQLAMQVAYHDLKGRTPATYESCSTAAFKHGRTETIRPATLETLGVCRAIADDASSERIYEMMKKCSTVHSQLTKEAALGQGFDRHLLALKILAEKNRCGGDDLPIYADPSYATMNDIHLSTSSLSNPNILFGGFAPTSPDGFGVGYAPGKDFLGYMITSYRPANSSSDFKECLALAMKKLKKVLDDV